MTEFSDGSYLLDDSDMYPVFDKEGRQVITIFDDLDPKIMNEYLSMKKEELEEDGLIEKEGKFFVGGFEVILPKFFIDYLHKENNIKKDEDDAIIQSQMPDAYSDEIYSWMDECIEKAGLKIPGNFPKKSKKLGSQIESNLYSSLVEKVNKYLNSLPKSATQAEAIYGVMDIVQAWEKEASVTVSAAFDELYSRGFISGIVSTGVQNTVGLSDVLVMNWIKQNPNSIGSKISEFSEEVIDKFSDVISQSYSSEGDFSVNSMVKKLQKIVPAERFKLERIVRTECAFTSNVGKLYAWSKDPDRFWYEYNWNASPDNRAKPISLWRMKNGPYSFFEICYLWSHQEQEINGKVYADQYNQRCSCSRRPSDREIKGNRFVNDNSFFETTNLGFDYNEENA